MTLILCAIAVRSLFGQPGILVILSTHPDHHSLLNPAPIAFHWGRPPPEQTIIASSTVFSVGRYDIDVFFLVKAEYWTHHHHQASREVPGPNTTTQQGVPSRLPRRRDDPNIEVRLWYHQAARQKGRTDYFIRSQPFDAQQRSIIAAAFLLWERRCDISKPEDAS